MQPFDVHVSAACVRPSLHPSIPPSLPPPKRWTGSNTNPNNNDGQGKQGTDRSNVVLLRQQNYPEGATPTSFGYWSNSYPAHLDARTSAFLGMVRQDREDLATLGNCESLSEMVRHLVPLSCRGQGCVQRGGFPPSPPLLFLGCSANFNFIGDVFLFGQQMQL